jgi:hypothetical protein
MGNMGNCTRQGLDAPVAGLEVPVAGARGAGGRAMGKMGNMGNGILHRTPESLHCNIKIPLCSTIENP